MNDPLEKAAVLVIDDDGTFSRNISSLLESYGYSVLGAASGEDGIRMAKANPPDIILLDVFMDGMSGTEACELLKSDPATEPIPVICITGSPDPAVKLACLERGASEFLTKPIDPSELILRVKNLLQLRMTDALRNSREQILKKHEELQRLFKHVERVKKEWELSMDYSGDMIILTDQDGRIKRCNRAVKEFTGRPYEDILWRDWNELFADHDLVTDKVYDQGIQIQHSATGRWFMLNSYPYEEDTLGIVGHVIMLHDFTALKDTSDALQREHEELEKAYADLQSAQATITQQEKMASIGQLAAGVAHEINNPTGFIMSNLGSLRKYVDKLREFIALQEGVLEHLPGAASGKLKEKKKTMKIDFILDDVNNLLLESLDGAERIKKIVQDLKSFSRVDDVEMKMADINSGIESTLNIVWNELKYKATVRKEYGELPMTKCNLGQLNQVFMNFLVNAAHAIEKQGEIGIRTWSEDNKINISISDTGCGIPPDRINRIFEPFYTTKGVGEGTGLGLSIAYEIVKKHKGEIDVKSEVNKGTTFTVSIPVVDGQ